LKIKDNSLPETKACPFKLGTLANPYTNRFRHQKKVWTNLSNLGTLTLRSYCLNLFIFYSQTICSIINL